MPAYPVRSAIGETRIALDRFRDLSRELVATLSRSGYSALADDIDESIARGVADVNNTLLRALKKIEIAEPR